VTTPSEAIAVAEFFAGIGLVAAALEPRGFNIQWANDIEPTKRDIYAANRPHLMHKFLLEDVRRVNGGDVPQVELATASFPCIDLSLAGNRQGLAGKHSGLLGSSPESWSKWVAVAALESCFWRT
jgi:DNA (cytosine-5)-methyltransferase 1